MRNVPRVALLAAFVVIATGATDDPPAPTPADVTTLVQNYLADAARLRGQGLSPEERASLTQRVADERSALKNARKNMRLKAGAKPFGTSPATAGGGAAQSVSRCSTCKFVWSQIELQLGSKKYPASVFASFEANCMAAQKSNIYWNTCQDMYDDIYAMTDDFLNDETAACAKAKMCPD